MRRLVVLLKNAITFHNISTKSLEAIEAFLVSLSGNSPDVVIGLEIVFVF